MSSSNPKFKVGDVFYYKYGKNEETPLAKYTITEIITSTAFPVYRARLEEGSNNYVNEWVVNEVHLLDIVRRYGYERFSNMKPKFVL